MIHRDTMYAVLGVSKEREVDVDLISGSVRTAIKLQWAPGQIGVLPVFDSFEAAQEYSGGLSGIVELRAEKEEPP